MVPIHHRHIELLARCAFTYKQIVNIQSITFQTIPIGISKDIMVQPNNITMAISSKGVIIIAAKRLAKLK